MTGNKEKRPKPTRQDKPGRDELLHSALAGVFTIEQCLENILDYVERAS